MNILFIVYGDYVLLLDIFYLDVYVKVASSDNLDIIYLIFGDVVRFVNLDPSNHTYETGSEGGSVWGMGVAEVWVGVGMGGVCGGVCVRV